MTIRWLTAFLDVPDALFGASTEFWTTVTHATLSAPRGEHEEFSTLLVEGGDPYLRAQKISDPIPLVHLDVHSDDPGDFADKAISLGATLRERRGYVVLESPGGFVFCSVSHHGESRVGAKARSVVDQICLDVPDDLFDIECRFWADLTGWELRSGATREFRFLERPEGMSLRILFQRLEGNDNRQKTRGHLDVAAGSFVEEVVAEHVALGASVRFQGSAWTTMIDPAGKSYCITNRDPTIEDSAK